MDFSDCLKSASELGCGCVDDITHYWTRHVPPMANLVNIFSSLTTTAVETSMVGPQCAGSQLFKTIAGSNACLAKTTVRSVSKLSNITLECSKPTLCGSGQTIVLPAGNTKCATMASVLSFYGKAETENPVVCASKYSFVATPETVAGDIAEAVHRTIPSIIVNGNLAGFAIDGTGYLPWEVPVDSQLAPPIIMDVQTNGLNRLALDQLRALINDKYDGRTNPLYFLVDSFNFNKLKQSLWAFNRYNPRSTFFGGDYNHGCGMLTERKCVSDGFCFDAISYENMIFISVPKEYIPFISGASYTSQPLFKALDPLSTAFVMGNSMDLPRIGGQQLSKPDIYYFFTYGSGTVPLSVLVLKSEMSQQPFGAAAYSIATMAGFMYVKPPINVMILGQKDPAATGTPTISVPAKITSGNVVTGIADVVTP